MTASLHKLSAGNGYDYLTRQVAAQDATERGYTGLASYYSEKGETPGVWVGSGCANIRDGFAGSVVSQVQMQALFGAGHNPIGAELVAQLGPGAPAELVAAATRLGVPFRVGGEVSAFRIEVARRVGTLNTSRGLRRDAEVSVDDRARIRTEVASEMFTAEFARPPDGPRELASAVARYSRTGSSTVAGFDVTFSPPKSVSALWAVADPKVAAGIEIAHRQAVHAALAYVERHLLYAREGTRGVRQVDVSGMVAAAFTHRDTRAGDPDLHTHVAVANKVRTAGSGKWLSIDARVLYRGMVSVSETYNTTLMKLLERQGFAFADRPQAVRDAGKRPVRELVGVPAVLNERWSSRRVDIEARHQQLVAAFQREHQRPPSTVESIRLAQQATLETRDAKHEPRSLAEQREVWHRQAVEVLGGERALRRMLNNATTPTRTRLVHPDAAWFDQTADRIVAAMATRAATWQDCHVRAEAQRMVRYTDLQPDQVPAAVERLVHAALGRSVRLSRPETGVREPLPLRRADGSSVYTVAGSTLYTSAAVVAAERHLVDFAGRADGTPVPAEHVTAALSASAADGVPLNPGQADLVRQMSQTGARLQLALAPAGAGKTTAMRVLTDAWAADGRAVIGLAPSAAAAAQLREHTHATTDTLAKLAWGITHHALPDWADTVRANSLVIIDEAGMADTLTLDTVVSWAVEQGASVRLIGDDQQLAAVGAGGVLRDIQTSQGASVLTELMRFTDPSEAAASLALRDGDASGLGFYLDGQRVHVGDLATMTGAAFGAWQCDTATGRASIMLAPTRELVGELNQRARTDRLARIGVPDGPEVLLADGNRASVGDTIITRVNDRRLRISRTDWVKNGDLWTVRDITADGGLVAAHRASGRLVRLPGDYVTTASELGYACTIHSAQGVSVDTMHGVCTGAESRQQFYTMMTRGRHANHVWLEVVPDPDPGVLTRPEGLNPPTPTDILETILRRDQTQTSASSFLRAQSDPRLLLGQATARYLDGLGVAAAHHLGTAAVADLETCAEALLPGITDQPAWPTLHTHLLLLGATGAEPIGSLTDALDVRSIAGAHDIAAVLSWRLDDTGLRNITPGPLPWLPGIPTPLAADPTFGEWLTSQSRQVTELTAQVRQQVSEQTALPAWTRIGDHQPDTDLLAAIEVWRAAMQVDPADPRPTGPPQISRAAHTWQRHLDTQLRHGLAPAMAEWGPLLARLDQAVDRDPFTHQLAEHLAALSRNGHDAARLVRTAADRGPLPDDHAAAALWWRIHQLLPQPDAAAQGRVEPGEWTSQLASLVGDQQAARITNSPLWPALVAQVDDALARGWRLSGLIRLPDDDTGQPDPCLTLLQRTAIAIEQPAELDPPEPDYAVAVGDRIHAESDAEELGWLAGDVDARLGMAGLVRASMGPPEATAEDVRRMIERDDAWRTCPASRDRLVQVNRLTQNFYAARLPGSWARQYLIERFGADLAGHRLVQPGHAPAGWTNLVDHLRQQGVTDTEMIAAGVARVASTGRLIDQFRDRVTFPITNPDGEILGFVARRNPASGDDPKAGPKYLNTAQTPLFCKGDQFYGHLVPGTTPVIVEGPMDAIAVTLGSQGRYSGLAPLGTSLTSQQAAILAGQPHVVIATDADLAGHVAAERDYWQLTPHGINPQRARFDQGTDPADQLHHHGTTTLTNALDAATPMADTMIDERVAHLPIPVAANDAARIIAALPADRWDDLAATTATRLGIPESDLRRQLLAHVQAWNTDPARAAADATAGTSDVRQRMQFAAVQTRWRRLANQVNPRLTRQSDWPDLETAMQAAHDNGHDVELAVRLLAELDAGSVKPVADLHARLTASLDLADTKPPTLAATRQPEVTRHSQGRPQPAPAVT
ncbi:MULTISPECIES: MobF family relaxase [Propionibacteriales]|uniref:MobF family relaxase n=1 Tax=Propionibacteriales TaxID=85009 RepID=UPI002B21094C|nr:MULTISPECIES: MobF family relaxase [Propionibacteriales]MEA4945833.1 MobF family relaxase [Propionicimonas sp.]MEA5155668.1 MobF family relaxase [Raineyella sp.]